MFRIESYITSIILSYVEKYVKNLRRQDAQVSLWDGEGLFQNLELDLDVLEKELNLPFIVLSGHINQLRIRVPWTKLGSEAVKITIDTIECVLKLKTPQQKKSKKNDKSYRTSTDYDELPPPSYVQSLINKIIGNLSVTCNNIILKYIEDDIVLSMNIKSITLDSCNENWIPDIIELTPSQLVLRKIIHFSDVTICLDRRNSSGCIETYLEPLLYKCSLSIRLCRKFRSPHSARPYFTQMDMFCSKITFILTEPQLPMVLRLLTMILELNPNDSPETNNSIDDEHNRSLSSCSSISESNTVNHDGWGNWMWSWVPSVNLSSEIDQIPLSPETAISGHTLNTGIYIDTLLFILKIKSTKKLNDYRPLLQITLNGSLLEMVSHPSDWINVQFGISKASIDSLGDCTCGAHDCYTNTYFSSGGLQNSYLSKSLFHENININELNDNVFSFDHHLNKFSETILLEKTPAFAIDYLFTQVSNSYQHNCDDDTENYFVVPEEKCLLRFVAGPSILNVSSGLVHRVEFIYRLVLGHDLILFTAPPQPSHLDMEEKCNSLINSDIQMMVYQFTIFNPMIKVFPACHVPTPSSQRHKKNQKSCLKQFNPPTAIFELKVLDGRVVTPKRKLRWSLIPQSIIKNITEEKKAQLKTKAVLRVKDLLVNVALSYSTHKILKINNIGFNTTNDCIMNYNSDFILDIDFIRFSTSKENCLLMYYIIQSIIMSNHRKLLHVNNYIFKSSLLEDAPGSIVLKFNLEGIKIYYKLENQISCIKIICNIINAKIVTLNTLNDNISSAILFSTTEFIKNSVPFFHVILQLPSEIDANEMPLIYFKVGELDMNFDPMLFNWLVYVPEINKQKEVKKKISTSDLAFFSAPSRKISETSISSDPKKKQPKQSIHSSVSENVSFHSANFLHLKNESKEMKIVHLFNKWKSSMVFVDTSQVALYFPSKSLSIVKKSPSNKNLDLSELLEYSTNNGNGLLVLRISNISLKCVVQKNQMEQYLNTTPVRFPSTLWSPDGIYFPWELNFHKLECYTIHSSYGITYQRSYTHKVQLLYPFSAQCTLAITTQLHNNNIQSLKSLAACIHCDSDPISICISEQQVKLVADLLKKQIEVYKVIFSNIEYGTFFNSSVAHEMSSIPEDEPVETKMRVLDITKTEESVKLSGWFQWTLARFSLIMKNNPEHSSLENVKLVLDLEDVISSLDFGVSYHKLKLKISSASVKHFIKNVKEEQWKHGPYLGIILKGYDPLNNSEKTSKTDGFLNFTLTRAYKSSFQGPKSNKDNVPLHMVSDEMLKLNQQLMDEYIMEIVIKVQPIDIVISPFNLHKFLSIIDPLLEIFINSKYVLNSSSNSHNILEPSKELLGSTLPLFYLDIALLRIFIPISLQDNENQDTIIIQINSIKINQNPENPITRTPLRKDLYIEAEKRGLLSIPGSIVEDRQYQIIVNGLSIKTGFWIDLKQVLECYQVSSTLDTDLQPNAALLWNEGKRPRAMGNSNLDEINTSTLFNKVSFHSVFAPAIIFKPENTLVCGSWIEVNTINEIIITLSVAQLNLLNILSSQSNEYILSHLKTNYTSIIQSEKIQSKLTPESLTLDSGVISTEDNGKLFDQETSSISLVENKINSQSNIALFVKKGTTTVNQIPIDVIITGNQINLNIFNCVIKNEIMICEPLLYAVIHQPHVFFSLSSTSDSCQVIFFDLTISLAPKNKIYDIEIPDYKMYSLPLFETKSNTMDEIPLAFFTLKMSRPISIGQYKIELSLGRAISLLLSKQKIDHIYNLFDLINNTFHPVSNEETDHTDSKTDEIEILKQSFKIESIVSPNMTDEFGLYNYENFTIDSATNTSTISETVENIIEIPALVNEHSWCSKPITMNLTTQQLFVQLSTENNDNIVFSVESIISKLNCLWKKPSERMNGEITLNSITISIGHNNSNYNTNELILYPWTMTLEIILSSDPWVPEYFRPTKQFKILTDFISFHLSPAHYNTLKLIWHEFKYVFEYNKKPTKNIIHSSESDEQFYQDDLRAGAFQFLETSSSDLPLPYQIFFSECLPKITWRYPQPRTLTKIEVQPIPLDVVVDIELHLQWYDEIQNCFRVHTSFIFPKYEPLLLRLEPWQAVSNTWRIIMDNACIMHSPLQIKSLVGCLRVDSYFSPSLVPQLQFSLSASSIKVNMSYDIKKKPYLERYNCISDIPPKHKLVILILDQVNIGFKLQEGEINTSTQAHFKIELLNYGTLTQIPIIKSFCLCTTRHRTKPIPDIQYNIQTGAISCQFGPSIINSLTAAIQLWKNESYFISTPYIIYNDTNFQIVFGQANTNEVITLDSLQCYQYTWCVPTEHPCIRLSVGSIDNLAWSNDISLCTEALMSLTVKNNKGEPHILIVNITNMSPSIIKVVVSSQLSILNKTNYLLDARFTKIKQIEEHKDSDQNLVLQTLTVPPEHISPSIMLYNGHKVTLKLRFNTPNHEGGPWSGLIPLHAVEFVNGNQNSWLVKIPKKDNIKKYRSIWCRLIVENINKIPRILILLMPMYVIRSYLPYQTLLNFELVDNKLEPNTIIQAKSSIALNDVQHIDLPGTMKDVYNLTMKLNEESSISTPPVSITYYMDIGIPESNNDIYFTIEDLLNGKFTVMDSDLQWPFIGKQYTSIKWKQCDLPDTQTTVKVQHYGHLDHSNGLSRVIIIQPWSLIVNTSGQIITLCNSTDILCTLDNFGVVAPPVMENTFYIEVNIDFTTHRSQPLQLSSSQSFYMPQVTGLIPLRGHTSVVINCKNNIGYLNICSSDHNNMRIIHIQSLYIASNHSSIDLKVLAVCAVSSAGTLEIPENIDEYSVDLPKHFNELGKPLTLWRLIGRETVSNEELVQYLILIANDNISCPIKLTELKNEDHPLPVLFSSCDVNPLICVTLQELDNQYFFAVYNQPYPQFILYNYCPVSLTIALTKKSKSKSKSLESIPFSIDWNWTYRITPGTNAYLSFPYSVSSKQFPRVLIGLDKKHFKGWFANIELSVCESRLVSVPGQINDIKVLITKRAFTLDVIFKPAAQFEFSANEVRLRLANSEHFKDTTLSSNELLNNVRNEYIQTNSSQNNVSTKIYRLWPSLKCHIHTFIFTLFVDDNGFSSKAVISMTLDNISATLDENQDASKEEMNLIISINNIQIDNNAFIDGHYDFPVLLVRQKNNFEDIYCDTSFLKPLSKVINDLRLLDSAVILKFTLDKSFHLTPVILDLEITLFTFEAFIEDRYCYYMLEILKNFKSTVSTIKEHNLTLDEFIPLNYLVLAHSQEYRNPLVFRTFTIKPFKVMISLHTSTTFYVALDRSPLDFTEFSKTNLIASSYQLGRSLSLHYFLNAIYGTGWALGSLEFWGSPGGLARSVGTGLYDFVTLSAQGMTEGPKEFFVGVLSGSASLVKHVTTGALSSVTKFASSWSRTFNRLTLEAEDLEQIEEIRRLRPQNLSQGIIQGLSEFGISLLGAVGGLVNHPIQYAIQEGRERKRGFVNTVAIGLVEAITKPISGAAELVAMTGEGFLAGVGWIKTPQLRSSLSNSEIGFGISELRYSWLILNKHLGPIEQVLLICDASMDNFDYEQKFSELTLVLTDKFLYLIKDPNSMLPNVLRLPITKIVTPNKRHHDPSLITITIRMSAQNDTTYARVADYVRKSQSFLNMESKTVSDQTHKLLVNPQLRNHILNFIEFLKRHIQNKGYAVI